MIRKTGIAMLCLGCVAFGKAQKPGQIQKNSVLLPNGWGITQVGKSITLGDLPLNMAVSKSKKYIAVTNNGVGKQTLLLIDFKKEKITDSIVMKKAWLGLAFSNDEKYVFASGGNDNWILRFEIINDHLVAKDTFRLGKPWPEKISPAGLAINTKKNVLYVVTKENNSLYLFDLKSLAMMSRVPLEGEGYACVLSPDEKTLFISCWGSDKVAIFNTEKQEFEEAIKVGDNPNDLCLDKNGGYLYVANANDNSISVINVAKRKVIEVLNCALFPDAPNGSTTNSIAMSEDNKTLYAANADNNCLAVFDITNPGVSKSLGFIPTGWYPTCVRSIDKTILVINGKGFSSQNNPRGPNPVKKIEKVLYQQSSEKKQDKVEYIGTLFKGTLSFIPVPNEKQLSIFSQQVYRNTPYSKEKELVSEGPASNPVPRKVGDASPIKHVFYIIKENRTYDQVLGDLPQGNGDTSLVLFGKKITPNQHALADEFVLLDNFYVDGEVSADGHNWSTAAYATDYLEKTWPTSYGGRGGGYDAEGNRAVANNKNGFIWDLCKKYNKTYRTYGEFADNYKPNIPTLKDHYCTYYTSWDESVKDTTRFYQWKKDFDSLMTRNAVPQLNTLRFINDHTEGTKIGKPTPYAHVADNDLAVGLFVEYLSKSAIWKESVVFILEDDAQNGPDHVDAHRSTAYLAGGFVKRHFVDHSMYSTSSVLRTIELILGLPPMSQYDAAAPSLWKCFTDTVNLNTFIHKPSSIDLNEKNIVFNKWSEKSEGFDMTKEDRVPDAEFNEVLWVACKGLALPCPPPKHAAFIKINKKKDDDD
jgi:YVTN family beta-propeller protein